MGQTLIGHLSNSIQTGLCVGQRCDAGAFGQRAQPVEPGRREPLPGAGVHRTGGIGRIVENLVTECHLVDRHQQIGVDSQADCAGQIRLGVDDRLGRELQGSQQRVQPASG